MQEDKTDSDSKSEESQEIQEIKISDSIEASNNIVLQIDPISNLSNSIKNITIPSSPLSPTSNPSIYSLDSNPESNPNSHQNSSFHSRNPSIINKQISNLFSSSPKSSLDSIPRNILHSNSMFSLKEYSRNSTDSNDLGSIADSEGEEDGLRIFPKKQKSRKSLLSGSLESSSSSSIPETPRKHRPSRLIVGLDHGILIDNTSPLSPKSKKSQTDCDEFSPNQRNINIPSIKDYVFLKPISKGAYGQVYLAKKKLTGKIYAIKVLKKSDMTSKNQIQNTRTEQTILTRMNSPFIVQLFYSFQTVSKLFLVMEFLAGGDCASLIKSLGKLDEPWTRQYISEVTLGLSFLHENGIVHRFI